MEWLQTVPILRIFDVAKAIEFYEGYLGFSVDWQHRFDGQLVQPSEVTAARKP